LSDLAAAGARPRWFLCALAVPRGTTLRQASGVARGMAQLARRHRCALIGGNVTAASAWSVTITALGEAARPLSRAGARPGDALLLSVPRRKLAALQRAVRCIEVGRIVRGSGIQLTEHGRPRPLPRVTGFDHLK